MIWNLNNSNPNRIGRYYKGATQYITRHIPAVSRIDYMCIVLYAYALNYITFIIIMVMYKPKITKSGHLCDGLVRSAYCHEVYF